MADTENNYLNNEISIDIFDVLRNMLKDFWLIILFGISTAMCSYIIANMVYKPVYETSATFVVTSKDSHDIYSNLDAATTVAETMTSIFSSKILENKVASAIGSKTLPGTIEAKVIDETNLFELTVTSSSPEMAYRIVTSIIENYTSVTNNVFGNAILDVLEAPEIPMNPCNHININKIMYMAFFIGMIVMAALLATISIIRDDIKNEDEVSKKLDTKLFGVVYHENKYKTLRSRLRKKKKSILITSPTVSFTYVESIKKMRTKFEYKATQKNSNVLLVTSVHENEGKSTIATNLAISLAQKSYKVLLVDADFCNPSVYKILQKEVKSDQEIGECISGKKDINNSLIFDENSGVFLLIGRKYYKNSTDLVTGDSFQKLINVAKKIMDYIIIDAPPITVSADTEIIADTADVSLLVVRQSTALAKNINDAIDILKSSKSELLGCVYNNARKNPFGYQTGYGNKYSKRYGDYVKKVTSAQDN